MGRSKKKFAPKRWNDVDLKLFRNAEFCRETCRFALLHDLDGTTFVRDLVRLAEQGSAYLAKENLDERPTEPVQRSLDCVRDLLAWTGFTDSTVQAGVRSNTKEGAQEMSRILGGEHALLDTVANFRTAVRNAAMERRADDKDDEGANKLMHLCDDLRDIQFPALGVEMLDSKIWDDQAGDPNEGMRWRYCIPRLPRDEADDEEGRATGGSVSEQPVTLRLEDLRKIPLEAFFKMGQFEGQFLEFNDIGLPTVNADGSPVSNKQLKRLMKKREKHAKRLEQVD